MDTPDTAGVSIKCCLSPSWSCPWSSVSLVSVNILSCPYARRNVLSSLLIKSLTLSLSDWEQCWKSWAAITFPLGSSHSRRVPTAASKVALSRSLSKSHSCRVQPLKCPANCSSHSSGDQRFQRDALVKMGNQSSNLTAGSSSVNGSTGGSFPLLTCLGGTVINSGSIGEDPPDHDPSGELPLRELPALNRPISASKTVMRSTSSSSCSQLWMQLRCQTCFIFSCAAFNYAFELSTFSCVCGYDRSSTKLLRELNSPLLFLGQ